MPLLRDSASSLQHGLPETLLGIHQWTSTWSEVSPLKKSKISFKIETVVLEAWKPFSSQADRFLQDSISLGNSSTCIPQMPWHQLGSVVVHRPYIHAVGLKALTYEETPDIYIPHVSQIHTIPWIKARNQLYSDTVAHLSFDTWEPFEPVLYIYMIPYAEWMIVKYHQRIELYMMLKPHLGSDCHCTTLRNVIWNR